MIHSSKKLTRKEFMAGFVYYAFYLLVLPSALPTINALLPKPLSTSLLNGIFFLINFLAVILIFHKFLHANLQDAIRDPRKVLHYAALGLCIHYVGNITITAINILISPAFANLNDQSMGGMLQENFGLMMIGAVLLVPIVEESFYRGLMFRSLFVNHPIAAYLVSMVAFGLLHIAAYVGIADLLTLLLCFFQYLPVGFALAWAYHRSGTIFTSILIHSVVNLVGVFIVR